MVLMVLSLSRTNVAPQLLTALSEVNAVVRLVPLFRSILRVVELARATMVPLVRLVRSVTLELPPMMMIRLPSTQGLEKAQLLLWFLTAKLP